MLSTLRMSEIPILRCSVACLISISKRTGQLISHPTPSPDVTRAGLAKMCRGDGRTRYRLTGRLHRLASHTGSFLAYTSFRAASPRSRQSVLSHRRTPLNSVHGAGIEPASHCRKFNHFSPSGVRVPLISTLACLCRDRMGKFQYELGVLLLALYCEIFLFLCTSRTLHPPLALRGRHPQWTQ